MANRVVVTGLGVVAPNGVGINQFREFIEAGKSSIKYIPELEHLGLKCHVGGIPEVTSEIKQRVPLSLINKIESTNLIYGILSGLEAWESAGLEANEEVDWESGAIMGLQMSDGTFVKSIFEKIYSKNLRQLSGRTAEQVITSALSTYLAGYLGLGNCAMANSAACATGTEAIHLAYQRIKTGEATRILAGSSESYNPLIWAALDHIKALNYKSNSMPDKASKPLSGDADGLVPGCGAGALVLENLESALTRNAVIYAEIVGSAANCGGQRNGGNMTRPNPEGIERCIKAAIKGAHIHPEQIQLISGHLTGTYADVIEIQAWAKALGCRTKDFPYINSLKSLAGHCLAAAGSIESVSAVLQLHHGFIHPNINCQDINPKILPYLSPESVPLIPIFKDISFIAKGNFGFGDVNCCLIFKKYNYE